MKDIRNSLKEQRQEVFGMPEAERRQDDRDRKRRAALEQRLAEERGDSFRVENTMRIARAAFPDDIQRIQYAPFARAYQDTSMTKQLHLFWVEWSDRRGTAANKKRLEDILRIGTDFDTLTLVTY